MLDSTAVLPVDGEVLHFSEDPTITQFVPHVAATARVADAYVCAVDVQRAPAYWFPRQCPRVLVWAVADSTPTDVAQIIGPSGASRVHAIEYSWLERMRTVQLYAYRFSAETFHPFIEPEPARRGGTLEPSAQVAKVPVRPLGPPAKVRDLFALHEAAGIELRALPRLLTLWTAVAASTLGFSGIRLSNAGKPEHPARSPCSQPRPGPLNPVSRQIQRPERRRARSSELSARRT